MEGSSDSVSSKFYCFSLHCLDLYLRFSTFGSVDSFCTNLFSFSVSFLSSIEKMNFFGCSMGVYADTFSLALSTSGVFSILSVMNILGSSFCELLWLSLLRLGSMLGTITYGSAISFSFSFFVFDFFFFYGNGSSGEP